MEAKETLDARFETIAQAFNEMAEATAEKVIFRQARREGEALKIAWHDKRAGKILNDVKKISYFLKKSGVKAGDSVAIVSASRPEWLEAALAIMWLGAKVVSIYPSLIADDIALLLYDAEVKYVFAENQEQLDKLNRIVGGDTIIPQIEENPPQTVRLKINLIVTFEITTLISDGVEVIGYQEILSGSSQIAVEGLEQPQLYPIASLVYTSGTTGVPKGVIQSHKNHLANIRQASQAQIYDQNSSFFMMLPLAHSFAALMGYIGVCRGVMLIFPSILDSKSSKADPQRVIEELSQAHATIYPVVPRVLEKIRDGIEKKLRAGGVLAALLSQSLYLGREKAERALNLSEKLRYFLLSPIRKILRKKLFGSKFIAVISGGAKLPIEVNRFFEALEIEVLEGYGLTETCVATNVNRIGMKKIGSVGKVLAQDIEVKLLSDGEIAFRGPNVTSGYFKRPNATSAAYFEDGWFVTGDLGSLDDQGFLSITGRKKELIVTGNGKKIAPEPIENQIKTHPLAAQVILYGDGRPYCVALISLNLEYAKELVGEVASNMNNHPQLIEVLEEHISNINKKLASFETIKKILITDCQFTIDSGYLTPTLKVKRSLVYKNFEEKLKALYDN
jgi:long-chain acyl-CoA synthetase